MLRRNSKKGKKKQEGGERQHMKGVLLNQAASHTGCEEWLCGCDIITVLYRSVMYILREEN